MPNKSNNTNATKLFVAIAIVVAALALVGAVAIETIVISQQVLADPPHGCKLGSNAFHNTDRNCFHTGL